MYILSCQKLCLTQLKMEMNFLSLFKLCWTQVTNIKLISPCWSLVSAKITTTHHHPPIQSDTLSKHCKCHIWSQTSLEHQAVQSSHFSKSVSSSSQFSQSVQSVSSVNSVPSEGAVHKFSQLSQSVQSVRSGSSVNSVLSVSAVH